MTIYCTDSQERIPIESFVTGLAVWSGGKPYLAAAAKRLGLKPDAAPPPQYADAMVKAELALKTVAAKAISIESTVLNEVPPAALKKPDEDRTARQKNQFEDAARAAKEAAALKLLADARAALAASQAAAAKKPAVETPIIQTTAPATSAAAPAAKPAEAKPVAVAAKPADVKPEAAPAAVPDAKPVAAAPAKPAAAEAKPPAAATPAAPVAAKPATPAAPAAAKPAAPAAGAAAPAPKKILAEAQLGVGEPLSTEELVKIPIFNGIAANQLDRLPGAVVLRKYKKGEIICHEGEYGSTAFYILKGTAEVYINTPMKHITSNKKEAARGGFLGIVRKFTHSLMGRKDDPRDEDVQRKYVPNDGPMDLPYDKPVAVMGPNDLFGEMTCLSFYPRSATVRADEDCEMLEMLRNVLQVLQKNKQFKEQLDKAYRERALGQHLRSVPILSGLDEKFIDQLRNRVELIDFEPGEDVFKQGDPADAFYLIRVGCVKVSQHHPGGELVLTYLGRGEYFGEMGLLKGKPRSATCTALDHVEVVKIKKADFDFMLSWYEDLRPKFEAESERREATSRVMQQRAPSVPLDDFLGQGLMHAQSLLLLDLEKCTRCDECVNACADSHDGVTRLVREGLRFDKYLVPTSCRSCMDPVCMIGCPVGSIRRKESLEIVIEDWCIGCGICAKQCPYGNISMHPFEMEIDDPDKAGAKKAQMKEKAVTCDLCTELDEPSCVYACPHDAAHRVDARKYFITTAGATSASGEQQAVK